MEGTDEIAADEAGGEGITVIRIVVASSSVICGGGGPGTAVVIEVGCVADETEGVTAPGGGGAAIEGCVTCATVCGNTEVACEGKAYEG